MKFVYFNLMPYTDLTETGTDWPVANRRWDSERGQKFYRDYIENLTYAEACGFDYAGVNDKRAYLLILIELNSRYAYVRAMTNAKAASAAAAMSDILAQNSADVADGVAPILRVRSDNGSEFSGEFAELLSSRGIRLEHPEANTHERMGRLDRFVRTLRGLIGGLFDVTGSHRYRRAAGPHPELQREPAQRAAPRGQGAFAFRHHAGAGKKTSDA